MYSSQGHINHDRIPEPCSNCKGSRWLTTGVVDDVELTVVTCEGCDTPDPKDAE